MKGTMMSDMMAGQMGMQQYAPQQPSKAEMRRLETEARRRQAKARRDFEAAFDVWRVKYDPQGLSLLDLIQAFALWQDVARRW